MDLYTLNRWRRYFEVREAGHGVEAACRNSGVPHSTAYRFERGDPASVGLQAAAALGITRFRGEILNDALSQEALKALDDFAFFRLRYFGRKSTPWQEMAAYDVLKALKTSDREYVVNNEPPGSGKSTLFTNDIPCWLICKDRTIRIQVGSRTERQARMYVSRIKRSLEREVPMRTDADSLTHGVSFDAAAALQDDYGPFRPEGRSDLWRAEGLVVRQLDGTALDDKEPTVSAWGMDSGFLGGRFDLVIWDDLIDKKNTRHAEARDALVDWYITEAEPRLEPGGALILQGQRIAAQDLYRVCLDMKNLDETPKYKHIVYQAHDESRCEGVHDKKAKPWPKGCLLDPYRLPWKMLEQLRHNNPRVFDVQYQQGDGDIIGGLAEMVWFIGGMDSQSYSAPGCFDTERLIGEIPPHLLESGWSIITVDPSPDNFWGIIWWVIDIETGNRYIVDLVRKRMGPENFLSLDLDTFRFSGLLQDLFERSVNKQVPLSHVVVETNAAQRWLIQQPHVQKWMANTGVVIVPHTTHVNKHDPKYGVEATGDLYRQGLIRVPWGDPRTRLVMNHLVVEATRYPDYDTDDLVMSTWFMSLAVNALAPISRKALYRMERPNWLKHATRGLSYASR